MFATTKTISKMPVPNSLLNRNAEAKEVNVDMTFRYATKLMRAIVEGTSDSNFVKDLNGVYLMMNASGAALFGLSPSDIVGRDDIFLFGPAAAKEIVADDERIANSGKSETYDTSRTIGNILHRFQTTKGPYRDESDEIVGVFGITRDITNLLEAHEILGVSESRYRSLFEINPLSTWVVETSDLRFLDVNEAAIKKYGYSRAEFLEMNMLDLHPGADLARIREALEGKPHNLMDSKGNRHRKKDGSIISVEINWRPLQYDGQPARLVVAYDVTERERAEEQRNALTVELQRSNRALTDFASIASHDLQEPLRKIQTFGDRLRSKVAPEGQDSLDRMLNAANRMQRLIDDLLTFSQVTTRAQPFVLTNLTEIATDVISDLEARIALTGGEVKLENLPSVYADPSQMRQILQNLIGNALKYHKPDVPPLVKVYAEMSLQEETPICNIYVLDNGIGFEEKNADRIFGVFERLHSRSEYEGTGIGLAIVRNIARRHGGDVEAVSAPGQGAKFIVKIPVRQRKAAVI